MTREEEVVGAEVLGIVDCKIKEICDYHKRVRAAVANSASATQAFTPAVLADD